MDRYRHASDIGRPFTCWPSPQGAACNLGCKYCCFLSKEQLYAERESPLMEEEQQPPVRTTTTGIQPDSLVKSSAVKLIVVRNAFALVCLLLGAPIAWPQSLEASAQWPSNVEEGNLFNEPFFQLSSRIKACKPPRGPWWTAEEARADIHWRTQSGVSCFVAGKCRLMNSYMYDKDIAERVKMTFERDYRFQDSSIWAHVKRRIVTVMGCAIDEAQKGALIAAMQGIDDVNQVIDQVSIGPAESPIYEIKEKK